MDFPNIEVDDDDNETIKINDNNAVRNILFSLVFKATLIKRNFIVKEKEKNVILFNYLG
jgi:hypothetical protein